MVTDNPKLYETYDKNVTKKLEDKLKTLSLKADFSENAISILNQRYLKKDENGVPQEDVKGMCARVSANVAYPDFYYNENNEEGAYETAKEFYEMMMNREFMPNSPTIMNAGREMQQLAACFVLPIEDKMEGKGSIMMGVYNTGLIHKSGGGTGFSFSKLRRKNDYVSTTYGKASGPVSFIEMYDATTHSVNQGGFRRGANMGMMKTDHPDILEFIHAKENEKDKRYGNFNFSVAITDDFMKKVKNGEHYILKAPRKGEVYDLSIEDIKRDEESVKAGLITENERILIFDKDNNVIYQNPVERDIRGRILKIEEKKVGRVDEKGRITLDAKIVFDEIAQLAWKNGEPGIAFIDKMNKDNPTPEIGEIESTNPCGEQPLLPYEACDLGSINLELMVEDGKINWNKLEKITKNGVHFLDNVVDMSNFPLEETIEIVHKNRKIGLGIMGWANMLIQLGIPYNSDEGVKKAEDVMKFIYEKAVEKTEELAEQRGAFPNFEKSIYSEGKTRRNATLTTIAPTGSIGIIAGTSGGIEPLFDLSYTHKDAEGHKRDFTNEYLLRDLKKEGIDYNKVFEEIIDIRDKNEKLIKKGKNLKELDYVSDKIKRVYIVSDEISPEWHVKMQAAFQKYTDNAVSKTIILPNSASVEDVKKAYLMAYELGCKGLTVYRKGSRQEEVLKKKTLEEKVRYIEAKKRPITLPGETTRKKTGCGNLFITTNSYDENLLEAFATIGKAGGCASAQNEAIGRLISFLLRINANPSEIASQLIGIKCNKPYGFGEQQILSCADAIGKTIAEKMGKKISSEIGDSENFEDLLEKNIENKKIMIDDDTSIIGGCCPICGSSMEVKEGCLGGVCTNLSCGFSECSG